jgi:YVTN family beta-propeller protein
VRVRGDADPRALMTVLKALRGRARWEPQSVLPAPRRSWWRRSLPTSASRATPLLRWFRRLSDLTGTNVASVIDTATNAVVGLPIPVGSGACGIALTPDGSKVYVANRGDNTVSVIDTATNTVVAVLPVGEGPIAFGVFIQPRFAGTPGNASCYGQSISALAQTFRGLHAR